MRARGMNELWWLPALSLALGILAFVYLSADVAALLLGRENLPPLMRPWTEIEEGVAPKSRAWRLPGVFLVAAFLQAGMTLLAFSPPRGFDEIGIAFRVETLFAVL